MVNCRVRIFALSGSGAVDHLPSKSGGGLFLNTSIVIGKLRLFLFYCAVFVVVIDILGGAFFAIDSLGYAAAFTVGTAVFSTPIWGLQGLLVLFQPRHYSANQWLWSLLIAGYMIFLIVVFFTLAVEFNLE